jgi:hypothetical protein
MGKNTVFHIKAFARTLAFFLLSVSQLTFATPALEDARLSNLKQKYDLGTPLGHGYRGAVFKIQDQPLVAKISHNDPLSREKLLEEVKATYSWERASAGQGFRVARIVSYSDNEGVAIKEFINGETVAAFLIRQDVFEVNKDGSGLRALPITSQKTQVALNKVGAAIEKMLRLQREGSVPAVSLSPNNIMVTYDDEFQTRVKDVILVDLGPSASKSTEFLPIKTMADYLSYSLQRMNGYLKEGLADIHSVTFAEAQKDSRSLMGRTQKGDDLRVYGLTDEILVYVTNEIRQTLDDPQAKLYFYGSRVMPRTEVIKRDDEARKRWDLFDDGVNKESIRTSGITRLSDLDVLIVTQKRFTDLETQNQIRRSLQSKLRENVRTMPLSLYIADSFERFVELRGFKVSLHQFVAETDLQRPRSNVQPLFRAPHARSCSALFSY